MIRAVLTGGPFDGQELGLAGALPSYLMLIVHPADPSYPAPIVVGAGFNDHWPGQQRYELTDESLAPFMGGYTPTATYSHVP